MSGRPLQIWVLSDGRAGHYNQARGIVQALARHHEPAVDWIELRLRAGFLRSLLRTLVNRCGGRLPVWLLHVFYRFRLPPGRPDLIVSAGGKTSFANAWLAQSLGVPNVYAGSLRRLEPARFRVVLTLEAPEDAPPFVQLELPPAAVDVAALKAAGERLRERLGEPAQPYRALLLGGDGAGYRFRQQDWQALAEMVRRTAGEQGIRWLVVTSRRTGREAEQWLASRLDAGSVALFRHFGDRGEPGMDAVLGAAERILVTEDSMTMLTEAMYAQKPVHSLRPAQAAPNARYERALQRFEQHGWLCRHRIENVATDPSRIDAAACTPLQQSPLIPLTEILSPLVGAVSRPR